MKVDQYPVLKPFTEYMESKWKGNLDMDHLAWMEDYSNEKTLFTAFILAFSGAWENGEVAEKVAQSALSKGGNLADLQENQSKIAERVANELRTAAANYSRNEWVHSHRQFSLYIEFGWDWEEIAKAGIREWIGFLKSEDYGRTTDWLKDARESNKDTFEWMFDDLDVETFGRLPTFDFLEITYRGGNIADLYPPPDEARRKYVKTDDPKQGFMIVFCSEDATIEAAEEAKEFGWWDARSYLDRDIEGIDELLQDTANFLVDQGWPEDTIVFDMESCFCIFYKEDDYKEVLPRRNELI